MGRDVELLRQNLPVAGSLVEHIHIVGVFKDVLHLTAGEQVFDVLGDARGNAAPLAKALPYLHRIGGGLLLLQKKVHFVDIVAGGLALLPVDRDAVPHRVLHHQHPDLFELLAQLLDIEADHAVFDIHVAAVVEHVERAGDIDFQRRGDILRFLFVLPPEFVIQVLQNRHLLRAWVAQVFPVNRAHTAVDDGLFHRHEAVLAAHDQLAQGEDEVGFQAQRVFVVAVIQVQIHGVQVVGGGGRDLHHLPVQVLHQRPVLRLRVADDDIVIRDEEHVGDLPLGGEGLAASGRT